MLCATGHYTPPTLHRANVASKCAHVSRACSLSLEEEEQLIFQHAVCDIMASIQSALPRPFLKLVCDAVSDQGIEDEQAVQLHARLCEHVQTNVQAPSSN